MKEYQNKGVQSKLKQLTPETTKKECNHIIFLRFKLLYGGKICYPKMCLFGMWIILG